MTVSCTQKSSKGFWVKLCKITDRRLMDVQQSCDYIGHKVTPAGLFSRVYSHIRFICWTEEMKSLRELSINGTSGRLVLKMLKKKK